MRLINNKKNNPGFWGIGPKFLLTSFIISLFLVEIEINYLPVQYSLSYYVSAWKLSTLGVILVLAGISFLVITVSTFNKLFKKNVLMSSGTYALCRHPIYTSWIIFIVPGILLYFHLWSCVIVPFFMRIILHFFISDEEEYLLKTFGKDYLDYKKRVNTVLPIPKLFRSKQN